MTKVTALNVCAAAHRKYNDLLLKALDKAGIVYKLIGISYVHRAVMVNEPQADEAYKIILSIRFTTISRKTK